MRTQHLIPLEGDSNVYLVVWRNQINDGLLVNLLHKHGNKTLEGYCQIDGTGQFDDITDGTDDITKIWDLAVEAGDIAGELLPLTITVTRKAEAGETKPHPPMIEAEETITPSTDIPEIPIPREVMEKVMALDIDANRQAQVADALGISGATLRRWRSRFHPQLGIAEADLDQASDARFSRAQAMLLANIKTLLEQGLTYEEVPGRLVDIPQLAVTRPESTNALPAWAQERIDLAMADLGLSDQDSLRQAFVALAELGWRGAAVEERVIQEIQQRAKALNIPVASEAVAGFSEYLLGVLAMRNGENVGDRLAELRPHLGRWISHNLLATAELLPFLRGLRAAPIISTLINTLANEGESGEEGVSISWDSLTRETMQLILQEVANRTTGSSPTDRIVRAAADILGQALASNDSTVAAEMRTVASDGAVQQVLRTLAAELKSKQSD